MKALQIGAILAMLASASFSGYESICTGDLGTRAFLTGSPTVVSKACSAYDYSKFFREPHKQLIRSLGK